MIQIDDGSASVELTTIKKMEGEATANNRKAKLIFLFEWELEVNFIGEFIFVTRTSSRFNG